jgi:hypothetical protein
VNHRSQPRDLPLRASAARQPNRTLTIRRQFEMKEDSMSNRLLGAENPRQSGNALKNGNFNKIVFRIIGICIVIAVLFGAIAYFFFT